MNVRDDNMTSARKLVSLDEEDFEELFAVIDHRSDEEEVVDAISDQLDESIDCFWEGEELRVKLNGEEFKLPLTLTKHDRYVAISSLAELLREKYTFWLATEHLEDDTHYLLVLSNQVSDELKNKYTDFLDTKLTQLRLGFDYFNDIKVPYLGHENNNPNFEKEANEQNEALIAFKEELRGAFTGNNHSDYYKKMRFRKFISKFMFAFAIAWLIYSYFFIIS